MHLGAAGAHDAVFASEPARCWQLRMRSRPIWLSESASDARIPLISLGNFLYLQSHKFHNISYATIALSCTNAEALSPVHLLAVSSRHLCLLSRPRLDLDAPQAHIVRACAAARRARGSLYRWKSSRLPALPHCSRSSRSILFWPATMPSSSASPPPAFPLNSARRRSSSASLLRPFCVSVLRLSRSSFWLSSACCLQAESCFSGCAGRCGASFAPRWGRA